MLGDQRVTFRLLPGKEYVYEQFKGNVVDLQHSDICFVLTSLMEAYNQGISKLPNPAGPVILETWKQHIVLNIGCNFNYNTKKARRLPPRVPDVQVDKNYLIPLLFEQWPEMRKESQQQWIDKLTPLFRSAGYVVRKKRKPGKKRKRRKMARSSVSTGAAGEHHTKFSGLISQCMTNVTGRIKRILRRGG